ncbi:hypothetical protein MRX96_040528 [Rhipicephalus microplus]
MSANQPKRARQQNFTKEELAIFVDVRRSQATTGGGLEDVPPLDEFGTRVTNALDPEAISGISGGLDVGAPSADKQPDNPFIPELSIPGPSHMAYEELGEGTCDAVRNVPSSAGSSKQDGDSAIEEQELFEHILEKKKFSELKSALQGL